MVEWLFLAVPWSYLRFAIVEFPDHTHLLVLLPQGDFVDHVFHKAYHLTSFLKHVSSLATGVFGCYSVLITLPLIFLKK